MVVGVLLIILAAVLNMALLSLPVALFDWVRGWCVDFAQKVHWLGRRGAYLSMLWFGVFEVLLIACLQMIIWGLAPHTEPRRWTLAVFTYSLARAADLIFVYKAATSQAERRQSSWLAALSCFAFSALMFAAFAAAPVHMFLAELPVHILHFIIGGGR